MKSLALLHYITRIIDPSLSKHKATLESGFFIKEIFNLIGIRYP